MAAPPLRGIRLPELPPEVLLRIVELTWGQNIMLQIKARLCLESCCKALRLGLRHQVWPAVCLPGFKAVQWALERKPVAQCLTVHRCHDEAVVERVLEAVASVARKVLVDVWTDNGNGISLEWPLPVLRRLSCHCGFTASQLSTTFPALRELRCVSVDLSQFSCCLPALVTLDCSSMSDVEQLGATFPALRELDCPSLDLSQFRGSMPALIKLVCSVMSAVEQLGKTFPSLRELDCGGLDLIPCSRPLPALVKLCCPSLAGAEHLSAAFPALRELDCGALDLSRLNGSLPALVRLDCPDLSGVELLSRTFPTLSELNCYGDLNLSQVSGSLPALVSLECCGLSLGRCSASFPALEKLHCHWDLYLEESSASFPVLTKLSCGWGEDSGQVIFGQSLASFPALTKVSCNTLDLGQYKGSFPALVEIDCSGDRDNVHGYVLLGQYSGSFPVLADINCYHLDLGRYSGSFPALTALTAVSGLEYREVDVVFPALRSLWLISGSKAAQMLQPPRLPPGITKLGCHVSMYPELVSPRIRQLETLGLWCIERDLPEGLEAAARLQTLKLYVIPEQGKAEGELSQHALSTLAVLKLEQSLEEVVLPGKIITFSRT